MLDHNTLSYLLPQLRSGSGLIGTVTANRRTLESSLDETFSYNLGWITENVVKEIGDQHIDIVNVMMRFLSQSKTYLNYNKIALEKSIAGDKNLVRELARYGAWFDILNTEVKNYWPIARVELNNTMMRDDPNLHFAPYKRNFALITAYFLMGQPMTYPLDTLVKDIIAIPKADSRHPNALEAFRSLVRSNYVTDWTQYIQDLIDATLTDYLAVLFKHGYKVSTQIGLTPLIITLIGKNMLEDGLDQILVDSSGGLSKRDDLTLIAQVKAIISQTSLISDASKRKLAYGMKLNIEKTRNPINFFDKDYENIIESKLRGTDPKEEQPAAAARGSSPTRSRVAPSSSPTRPRVAQNSSQPAAAARGSSPTRTRVAPSSSQSRVGDVYIPVRVDKESIRERYERRGVSKEIINTSKSFLPSKDIQPGAIYVFAEEDPDKEQTCLELPWATIKFSSLLEAMFIDHDMVEKHVVGLALCSRQILSMYVGFVRNTLDTWTDNSDKYDDSNATVDSILGFIRCKDLLALLNFAIFLDNKYLCHHLARLYNDLIDGLNVDEVRMLLSFESEPASHQLILEYVNHDGFDKI